MWVRLPPSASSLSLIGRALFFEINSIGSSPVGVNGAVVPTLVERPPCKWNVVGSNPTGSTHVVCKLIPVAQLVRAIV